MEQASHLRKRGGACLLRSAGRRQGIGQGAGQGKRQGRARGRARGRDGAGLTPAKTRAVSRLGLTTRVAVTIKMFRELWYIN
jgi:hypothetical protein